MITNMFDFVRLPVTAPTGTYASFGVPMAPLFSHTSSGSTPGQFTVQHGYADHSSGNAAYAGDSIVIEGVPYTLQSVQLTYFTLTTTTMSLPSFTPTHPSHLVTGHYIVLSPVGGGPDVAYLGLDEDYTITGDITGIEVYSSPSTSRLALSEYDSNRSFVCFASGTMIMTEEGNVPVNALKCGDMVLTRDSGFRPIQWIGKRTVAATGAARPVVFLENSIGNRAELTLSQNHRVLVNSRLPNFGRLELIADTNECLVAAKHLVNGKNIVFRDGGVITYFHFMFDRHEIVYSEGVPTESFCPGEEAMNVLESETRNEILDLFPEIACEKLDQFALARMELKAWEVNFLREAY